MRGQLASQASAYKDILDEKAMLETAVRDAHHRNASMERRVEHVEAQLTSLQQVNQQLLEENTQLKGKNSELEDQVTGLETEKEIIRSIVTPDKSAGKRQHGQMQKPANSGSGGGGGGGGSGGSGSSSKRQRGSLPSSVGGNGRPTVRRSTAEAEYCKSKGLCMYCYENGHIGKHCKATTPAKGKPPGMP